MNYACELCGDCGATGASAAMADSANHNKVSEFSFADVVCRINFWVCGETEKIFEVFMCEVVDKPAHSDVLVIGDFLIRREDNLRDAWGSEALAAD